MVWAPQISWVGSVNVTDRYLPKVAPVAENKTRLLVKVLDGPAGKRVAASLTVTDTANPSLVLNQTSKDESADLNDIASFEVASGRSYRISALLVQPLGRFTGSLAADHHRRAGTSDAACMPYGY